jgi:hypothetical protein
MINRIPKRAQQEMVGFVLIVVIVIIALFVFLVINAGQKDILEADEGAQNLADNMLSSIMKTTTGCAPVYEPDYDSVKDLFKSAFLNKRCNNLGVMADDYLNETIHDILSVAYSTEATLTAYELDYSVKDEVGQELRLRVSGGVCEGVLYGSHPVVLKSGSDSLVVTLRICA